MRDMVDVVFAGVELEVEYEYNDGEWFEKAIRTEGNIRDLLVAMTLNESNDETNGKPWTAYDRMVLAIDKAIKEDRRERCVQ